MPDIPVVVVVFNVRVEVLRHAQVHQLADLIEMHQHLSGKKKRSIKKRFRIKSGKHRRNLQVPVEEARAKQLNTGSKEGKKLLITFLMK